MRDTVRWGLFCLVGILAGCSSADDAAVAPAGPDLAGSGGIDVNHAAGSASPNGAGGESGGHAGDARADSGGGGQGGVKSISASDASSDAITTANDAAVVVRTCKDLPAPGHWELISPPEISMPSNMEAYGVAVSPSDQIAYATGGNKTDGGDGGPGVLRSTDCGATWAVVSTGTNADKLRTGALWAVIIDPSNSQTLYVPNGYGNNPTIYKSIDGAVNWSPLNPDPEHTLTLTNFVQAIALDPRNPKHLAVTFHDTCKAPHTPLCFSQSTDAGATWHVFDGPTSVPGTTITGWEEGASISVLGTSSYLFTAVAGTWYTADGGAHWTQLVVQAVYGAYGGTNHIGPDGTLYMAGNKMYVSPAAPASDPPFAIATGQKPTALANSPSTTVMIDDGVTLFASLTSSTSMHPFWTAPLAAPTTWTQTTDTICGHGMVPSGNCRGSNQLAYDSAHHIIYSANWGAGLWRMVTR